MPRNKRHGSVAVAERPITESTEETPTMPTVDTPVDEDHEATAEQDTAFEFDMAPAPDDYEPERKTPGRERKPSFFDDKLRASDVFMQGWQRVPATSEEHKAAILRELNRAKLYLNKLAERSGEDLIGLDLDDKQDDAVYFKSRVAQKRERKNGEAVSEAAAEDGLETGTGDDDE